MVPDIHYKRMQQKIRNLRKYRNTRTNYKKVISYISSIDYSTLETILNERNSFGLEIIDKVLG